MISINRNDPSVGTVAEWQAWARRNGHRGMTMPNAYTVARRYAAEHGQAIVWDACDGATIYTFERGAFRHGVVRVRQYPGERVRWVGGEPGFKPAVTLWALWSHEEARTLGIA